MDRKTLFSLAAAIEREAIARYLELAREMRRHGNEETAKVFDRLAEEERGHERTIEDWADEEIGSSPETRDVSWQTVEVFAAGEDEDDLGDPERLTPYRALSIAVHNEERAFAFFSYAAAHAPDERARTLAERLAREELNHAAILRRHRRQAYHALRRGGGRDRFQLGRVDVRNSQVFFTVAAALEEGLSAHHESLGGNAAAHGRGEVARLMQAMAKEERERARSLQASATEETPGLAAFGPPPELRASLLDLEEAYEFYVRAAEQSRNETQLRVAQALAEAAIGRIARLRHGLDMEPE